jgi:DNA gyrase subunit B
MYEAINGARGLLKPKEAAPTLDDIVEGMTAIIHVRAPEPQFTSQTKDELSTAGVMKAVQLVVEQGGGGLTSRKVNGGERSVIRYLPVRGSSAAAYVDVVCIIRPCLS